MADGASFEIQNNDLLFTFTYDSYDDQLNISCLHITQFYEWDTIIGKGLDKSSSDHMKIVLSPKKLFELFCKFKDGLLNEYSKVNLQNKMKAQDCPIAIEIITYAPFDPEQSDVKQILLYAKNISTEERNCKKIQQRDSQVDNLLSVIKQMSVEMQDIKFRMKRAEKTADFAAQKIKDLETRNIYTKEEVNNLVTNFNDAIRDAIRIDVYRKQEIDEITKKCMSEEDSINVYEKITTRMNEIDTKIGNYQTSFNDLVEKLNAKQLYSKEEIDSLLAQCVKNA